MAQAVKNVKKESYEAILSLYDKAEELVECVESVEEDKRATALDLVEPVIVQLEETTGILSESFITFGETGEQLDAHNKRKAETAFRKLFNALSQFCESAEMALLGVTVGVDMGASDLRAEIVNLEERVEKKYGKKFTRIFSIMLWIGDHLVKLAKQLEKVGTGIQSILAIPGQQNLEQMTEQGRVSFLEATAARAAKNPERGWAH